MPHSLGPLQRADGRKAAALESLRQHFKRLESRTIRASVAASPSLFGHTVLDGLWSGDESGLPWAAVHEIAAENKNSSGFAAVTAFAAVIAGRLRAPVLWCMRGPDCTVPDFYAPGLAAFGLAPQHLLIARARSDTDVLAILEEGLRHRVVAAVVGEIDRLDLTTSRRLSLASEKAGAMTLILRRPPRSRKPTNVPNPIAANPIAAASRWRVGPRPSVQEKESPVLRPRWQVELLRSRQGATGSWSIEIPYATQDHFHFPAPMADRGAYPPGQKQRAAESQRLRVG